jgi:L-fuconate dehydratase
MIKITNISVNDVRFPTSKDQTGSDAIHTNPDYSATYITISTSDNKLKGYGITFTLGKGNDIVASCIKHFFPIINGLTVDEIEKNIGKLWFDCVDHSQLRWLGPEKGVVHLAVSAIFNALWDLIARKNKKPLWLFVIDSEPETIINWLTFKYIEDVLTPEDAHEIILDNKKFKEERLQTILKEGYPSYTTAAGWLGYSDEKISQLCKLYMSRGWKHFKVKVGVNLQEDIKRLKLIRRTIGKNCSIMIDANQQWSVDQSIKHINELKKFNILFAEEPTNADDVLGFVKIKKAVGNVKLATGEACSNRIMFKQFLESGAMNICQIDSCRLGSINEILTVLLMAHKFKVPVFPHAGGVGLCEYVQHLCMIDYVLINGEKDDKVVEYQDSLHDHFIYPCHLKDGNYMPPLDHGYSIEMKEKSVNTFSFPEGEYWSKKK